MRRYICHALIAALAVALTGPVVAQDSLLTDGDISRVIELRTTEASPRPLKPAETTSSRAKHPESSAASLPDPAKIGFDEIGSGEFTPQPSAVENSNTASVARQADVRSGFVAQSSTAPQTSAQVQGHEVGGFQTPQVPAPGTGFAQPPAPQPPANQQPAQYQYQSRGPVVDQTWNRQPAIVQDEGIPQFAAEVDDVPAINTSITPQISTRIISPKSINLNEPAHIKVQLKNNSRADAGNVALTAVLPAHVKLSSSSPRPTKVDGQTLSFSIQRIGSGQTQEIQLNVISVEKQPMQIATSVRIQQNQGIGIAVRQPQLKIEVAGPAQGNMGNWTTHTVTVTNIGDGVARNVQLDRQLPEQLQIDSTVSAAQRIEQINPGQSKKIILKSMATAAGEFDLKFSVAAKGCDACQASHQMRVFQPELQVSVSSPELTFVNRDGIYSFIIENKGQVDVNNVVVALATSPGIKVTTVSREATVDQKTGHLSWKFAKIPAGGSETIQLKARATTPGNQICELRVSSNETVAERFELATQVQTHADVGINLINQNGPIEVGAQTEFIVKVENRGSRIANGVDVAIELAPSLMPVTSPVYEINELDNTIRFKPLEIPAGETKELKFTVAGVTQGEHVVRGIVKMADSARRLMTEDSVFVFEPDQSKVSESLKPQMKQR